MDILIGVIVGLIILTVLVVIHELGHGLVARRNGVVVKEFGVGFPPKAWGKKLKNSWLGKNVEYTVNWLPLGGFVRLKGEYDSADKPGDYGAASYWVKTKILLAGVVMNWVAAIILFTVLAWIGLPQVFSNQFSVPGDTRLVEKTSAELKAVKVGKNSAAEKAGVRSGDQIMSINGVTLNRAMQVTKLSEENKGKTVPVVIKRDGKQQTKQVTLRGENNDRKGYLGVSVGGKQAQIEQYATWSAPIVGAGVTAQYTIETFKGLGDIAIKTANGLVSKFSANQTARQAGDADLAFVGSSVAGPVGILGVIFPEVQKLGIKALIQLAAIISLTLAVMNVLPIPALDGGRWFVMTGFKLARKKLTREREENIQAVGMVLLLGLIILVTIADIGKVV